VNLSIDCRMRRKRSFREVNKIVLSDYFSKQISFFVNSNLSIWIGLAQLVFGVLGLSAVVAGSDLYAVKDHQLATNQFFNSFSTISYQKCSLYLEATYSWIDPEPIKRLNLPSAFKSVALDYIFLSKTVCSLGIVISFLDAVSSCLGLRRHQQ
jgi:hypothetical protein